MELGGPQRRPRQAGVRHDPLGGQLAPEVAEHRPVEAADQRDPVRPDDRDVHQVRHPGPRRGLHQVPGRLVIARAAARAVHDDLSPGDRRPDPLAGEQVTGHVLDAITGRVTVPAEYPQVPAGVPEPREQLASQRPRTAGNQNERAHESPWSLFMGRPEPRVTFRAGQVSMW